MRDTLKIKIRRKASVFKHPDQTYSMFDLKGTMQTTLFDVNAFAKSVYPASIIEDISDRKLIDRLMLLVQSSMMYVNFSIIDKKQRKGQFFEAKHDGRI